ncbi:uncharacterized protein [Nicotiana tomentosiformis]|uniref:uncharacterized protein isoform X4 n=1 Tax=Nicotiana tomentosiformis TaxID=4098 RepID=UPI00388CC392
MSIRTLDLTSVGLTFSANALLMDLSEVPMYLSKTTTNEADNYIPWLAFKSMHHISLICEQLVNRSSIDHPPIQTLGLKSIICCMGYMSGVIYCYVRNRSTGTGQRKTILLQENGLRGNQLDQSKQVYLLHGNIKANMCTSCMETLRVEYDIVGPDEDTQFLRTTSQRDFPFRRS